jgi:hypothetical protein
MNPAIQRYISAIKNQGKRAYADAYYCAVCRGEDPPARTPYGINLMAGQAVQMAIDSMMPKRSAKEQKPCDVGLFGDDSKQLDLIDNLKR